MAKRVSKSNQSNALKKEGKSWIERIEAAWKREDTWAKDAEKAVKAYTNEAGGTGKLYDYNILHANTETIVPAIINSPPVPDIRRRFGDDDPVAKQLSDIIERAISVQVDDSRLAVELEGQAQDGFLAGRGVIRLRFHADTQETETSALEEAEDAADDTGEGGADRSDDGRGEADVIEGGNGEVDEAPDAAGAAPGDNAGAVAQVTNERITFEAVSWRDYQHGPAKRWEDRPWESYRHVMQHEDVKGFSDQALVAAQTEPGGKMFGDADTDTVVYEIWDKRTGKVVFVRDDGTVLKKLPDPLGLSAFFPSSRPVQPIEIVGRLMPVTPFSIYAKLADELDILTKRIRVITAAMKIKGAFVGGVGTDLMAWATADDNELISISGIEAVAQMGGIDKAVTWWPVDKFQPVLAELFKNRDLTKQAIYEITGISDIVRGASSPSETLGAQQIKTQWGSLRIQKMQRMMERSARDLFVMMSEIVPAKFTYKTLEEMTAVPINILPTDAPGIVQQKQQLQALMKQKITTRYRVDVESESTIRADLTNKKKESAEFLSGSAAYFAAVGPLVQDGTLPADAAIEIYAANARLFNLGKSVEDTIEHMVTLAKEKAQQLRDNPPPPQPNPDLMKVQNEAAKAQSAAQDAERKSQIAAKDLELQTQSTAAEARIAATVAEGKIRADEAKAENDRLKIEADGKAQLLDSITKIVVARIGAQTDIDSASIEGQLAQAMGLQDHASQVAITAMQHAHEKTMQANAPKPVAKGAN